MTLRILTLLATLLLALAVPAATAEAPQPELPRVYECSQFQVDWYHCDDLVCLGAWYGRVAVYQCVPDEMCVDASNCVVPGCPTLLDCLACYPGNCIVEECSQFQVDWNNCAYLVCVSVDYDRIDQTRCVDSPCPDLQECFTCQIGNCLPYVNECSEFQVDWNYCPGMIVCVSAGHPWINVPVYVCVRDPCPPNVLYCILPACDVNVCSVPSSCDETVSNNYGSVDCDGERVIDWHCLTMCPPTVGPFYCHQDTTGRVECYTPTTLL